ncbi:uncharacterized protein LOC121976755 isoform X1 [Zingiber officinale]|uniref:uncharacterized protein LOC121976755 isoform X1 n=1 Tax=Zingiber officinale TaxID=94328 RepID=UPI001C4C8CE8|nr:uncharacterized protein LOC121976755 isoform X1 [Zingiber officinale]
MGFLEENFLGGDEKKAAEMGSQNHPAVPCPIPNISLIADSVVRRCSRILMLSVEQLHQSFEAELPENFRLPADYARNLVEYCSYKALRRQTQRQDYLADKEFSLLTFDMMLAWEVPDKDTESLLKEKVLSNNSESDDDDGSLFYASRTRIASQINSKKTVGLEAFARIAPACAAVADPMTVHNLFDALTSCSGGQLHFLIYDKYLKSLYKLLQSTKRKSHQPQKYKFNLIDGEIILDTDAKSVVQQNGTSKKPGRLTLTSHALYFEASGVASYDKAVIYDLSKDLSQVVKCELTGPWGARLFDKAIMYKSDSVAQPIFLEFSRFSDHSYRDYWFVVIQEVLNAHKFIRKYKLKRFQTAEALAKAILGIFRYRAVKKAFQCTPSHFKSILAFNLAEKLPKGDKILEALHSHLELMQMEFQNHAGILTISEEMPLVGPLSDSLYALTRMGFLLLKKGDNPEENDILVGNVHVGQTCPLQTAVKKSFCYSYRAEAADATFDQVKVVDINTNLAVIQAILFPLSEMGKLLRFLASWEEPFKSRVFLFSILYLLYSLWSPRGWIRYIIPCIFFSISVCMFWHKHHNNGKPVKVFQVSPPPSRGTVELLSMLQDGVSQLQTNVQIGTISLLKLRALFLAIPQTTTKFASTLMIMAVAFSLVPFRHLLLLVLLEVYTRNMPLRKASSEKLVRRIKEWWNRIPAAPIQITNPPGRARYFNILSRTIQP